MHILRTYFFIFILLSSCSLQNSDNCSVHPPSLHDLEPNQKIHTKLSRTVPEGYRILSNFTLSKNSIEIIEGYKINLTEKEIDPLDNYFSCAYKGGALFHHETNYSFKLFESKKKVCEWQYKHVVGCVETDVIRASFKQNDFYNTPTTALWRNSKKYSTLGKLSLIHI